MAKNNMWSSQFSLFFIKCIKQWKCAEKWDMWCWTLVFDPWHAFVNRLVLFSVRDQNISCNLTKSDYLHQLRIRMCNLPNCSFPRKICEKTLVLVAEIEWRRIWREKRTGWTLSWWVLMWKWWGVYNVYESHNKWWHLSKV